MSTKHFSLRRLLLFILFLSVWIGSLVTMYMLRYFNSEFDHDLIAVRKVITKDTILYGAIILGAVLGFTFFISEMVLEKRNVYQERSYGQILLTRSIGQVIVSLLALIFLIVALSYFSEVDLWKIMREELLSNLGMLFFILNIIFVSLALNFVTITVNKIGPIYFRDLFLGKYRTPNIEDRIFMFLDLNASTSIAEGLGHQDYSRFIRDCFNDLDHAMKEFNARVYQYVGDEAVLTWNCNEKNYFLESIDLFFSFQTLLKDRREYYYETYGTVPFFKAGVDAGKVTGVEVGVLKREIAFHGDVLNTAARLEAKCNEYQEQILISDRLFTHLASDRKHKYEHKGEIELRGKSEEIDIYAVSKN